MRNAQQAAEHGFRHPVTLATVHTPSMDSGNRVMECRSRIGTGKRHGILPGMESLRHPIPTESAQALSPLLCRHRSYKENRGLTPQALATR